jgi:5-formyltetrahydrofolate cyclo-ligase
MDKKAVRKQMRLQRSTLSSKERTHKDRAIARNLEAHPLFQTANTVLFYVSNEEEVDTHALIQKHLGQKNILIPTVTENQLKPTPLTNWNDLILGTYEILEVSPEKQQAFAGTIDLVIVPGIAFDHLGHRLGYGKGYYDFYLSNHDSPTIGLSYENQLIDRLPTEPHDIALDTIITDKQTLTPS